MISRHTAAGALATFGAAASLLSVLVIGEERLLTDLQPKRERIRDVRQGLEGALYLLTDTDATSRLLKLVPK
jgi:glucose/arabinose dehydrogenase